MISGANITVLVSDMQRALEFYTTTLGLEFVRGYGEHWQEVKSNGVIIGLHPGGKKPLAPHGRHMQIGLRVEDLDQAMAALSSKGVKFTRIDDKGSRIANFTDPDGNPLYLIELKWG